MNGISDETTRDLSKCWQIIHIPDKPHIDPELQDTVNVVASEVEPKHANLFVRKLNKIAPLENLRHVKRIRKKCLDGGKTQLVVILCMAFGDDESTYMPGDVLELVNTYQLITFITKVFKYAASTKEEWEAQCKLWPTSFHPPTYNIDGITGFSEEDSLSIFRFMKHALCLAKSGDQIVNAAVIVDPSTQQIISSSSDQLQRTNIDTSCSKPTTQNEAKKIEKNPSWLLKCSSNNFKKSHDSVSCLNPWGWLDQQHLHSSPGSWHPLGHAALLAIEMSTLRDRLLFPLNGQSVEIGDENDKSSSPLKRQKIDTNDKDESKEHHQNGSHCNLTTRPYLCTGYDIYFVWEPCIMCAMAIVHQRVKRVFYALPNLNDGALGSVHRLQGEKSLNHHYAVFRVLVPEEIL